MPRLIPLAYLRRARLAAYLPDGGGDRVAGVCGGLFVVPINAALQEVGYKTIGSGGAVAIQNFFENLSMLLASGVYALVAGAGVDSVFTMVWLGVLAVIATVVVSWHLPRDTGSLT